ncbi:MAG: hypothetical protein CM15mV29_0810 [uncultured marine virus]|nr:MAG: hypothetical protein CM15mV29_0810 [uncultured marine virus]
MVTQVGTLGIISSLLDGLMAAIGAGQHTKRQGTRLAITPSLGEGGGYSSSPDGGTTTNDQYVTPNQATSRIGISEIGVSPIFLDMTMTGFIPADDNRMVMIEFDRENRIQFSANIL